MSSSHGKTPNVSLDRVGAEHPKAVEDLVPKLLPLAAVQRVLQNLLRERVSIRDSLTVVEALGEAAVTIRNPILITEYVRQCLRRILVKPYLKPTGELAAYLVSPAIEQIVEAAAEHGEQNSHLTLAPQAIRDILHRIGQRAGNPETPCYRRGQFGLALLLPANDGTFNQKFVFYLA